MKKKINIETPYEHLCYVFMLLAIPSHTDSGDFSAQISKLCESLQQQLQQQTHTSMKLTFEELKAKMPDITALLLTEPVSQDERATEVWIKFRRDGVYAYINFERPLPEIIMLDQLVGAGDALNCSESKKDTLTQYSSKADILEILQNSYNFKGNIKDTVLKVEELINVFKRHNILLK